MEASHSRLTTGEEAGGQERRQPESPHRGPRPKSPPRPRRQHLAGSPKPRGTPQQPKPPRRQHPERKRLRHQRQSAESDAALEHSHEGPKASAVSSPSPGSAGGPPRSKPDSQDGDPKPKRERKPQRPGKYVCTYCGRACAKPSVLQKHIRSHTGERPYPCAPCGFSFKTKSNLYKHRKSHTHRVKAGLAPGEPRTLEEQVTESEDESRQLVSASSLAERQSGAASTESRETDRAKDGATGNEDSRAVKKRLALRLSRGKPGSDEKTSSLILGSKGSTESGYFSRSESTERSQDSPPNTSAKSYAEIILGKYGRLGHLQRMSRQHNQQPSGQEDKNMAFTVPKKQVIDHITKLITINEAVVDTSKIDSVKPRRFSLSRKNSSESQKSSSVKDALIHSPKAGDPSYKSSGSITMGVPCEKFQHPSSSAEQPAGQTSNAPLVRSHSMPAAASSFDASSGGLGKFRLTQSFDEHQPPETQASRRYRMLRRQPAIEIPLGGELSREEREGSGLLHPDRVTAVPDHRQSQPLPYECEACGTGCNDWEGYKRHKKSLCLAHRPKNDVVVSQMGGSPPTNHAVRAGASAMRKRRKEESLELDDPSSPSLPSTALLPGQCRDESNVAYEGPRRPALQTCSVIQHTRSFEKQESFCIDGLEAPKNSPLHEDYQRQPQHSTKPATGQLAAQHGVRVPEILVTEDPNVSASTSIEPTPSVKPPEKAEEFQWPQRSTSLSQLPIEKLPPKKKRLRLAEAAQSSGESSFDSVSLPRSPSQDSSASYASSRSTSFEESNRPDLETAGPTPLRRSRAPHMLTVPGAHQQREMRRSASEQAPHDPQRSVLMAEARSKSFDYSCLSPERSAVGWRERRKCLLVRHTAIRDPDEEAEEEKQRTAPSQSPERVSSTASSKVGPASVQCSRSPASPLSGDAVTRKPGRLQGEDIFSQWKLGQNVQLTGSAERIACIDPVNEASRVDAEQPPLRTPRHYPPHGPSGAARAHYLPMSTGLKLEIPLLRGDYSEVRLNPSHIQPAASPHITSSLELLRPVPSPAVAVRLQTDTLNLACAIYTSFSRSTSPRPQEAVDAVSQNTGHPTAERQHRNTSTDPQTWSDDGLRVPGSGGNKRMLSPSNSMELPPESQQQQKRVKEEEEEEGEVGRADGASVDPRNQVLKRENQTRLPSVCSSIAHVGPSYPGLLSSTCNSWCYLNYIKPNPCTLDEQKPSVYSSWSTSGYDPNPPGLSSRTALSLLQCKQRLSPSIYTVSPMSVRTSESMEQEDTKRPCSTEVYNSHPYRRDPEGATKGQLSADGNGSHREGEREDERKNAEEEAQSGSRNKPAPEVWSSERGSNEKRALVHCGGGGGERCQCVDCPFNLKSTASVLQKCPRRITESPPRDCEHCYLSVEAEGSPIEHSRSESHGEEVCRNPDGSDGGVCEKRRPDEQKGPEDEHAREKDGRPDEDNRVEVAESSHTASPDSGEPPPGGRSMEPEPGRSVTLSPKSSASGRRALFARRRLDASTSASSEGSRSPRPRPLMPRGDPSPPRSPSPRARRSPAPLSSPSSPSCHVSSSTLRPVVPVRGLSPVTVQPHGSESRGPAGSFADLFAPSKARLHPGGRSANARPSPPEEGQTPAPPPPTRPRGAHTLLSHLPLHSQPPSRSPSLLIPIGGIHMIQPRSTLPLYSLVSSPAAVCLAGRSRTLSDPPKGGLPPPPRPEPSETVDRRGRLGARCPASPGTETGIPEVIAEVRVYREESTQGPKKAPSSQTQL
uniref:HIVEP zinc finger 3a n=1 Tax=Gasterosteus aculeatus aculeatus TaxID=481459 RepID=A0AAQ4P7T2_GASAC|nr:transcription factor HIVEP3 isoform X1 [Gasterosteus aculeatus aculeatus]XP_040044642.1 transcription factor HIVEP3 isoform X1 [Gasterosteus aculeatus aculeatus]XP_040044643.1 transcription factor HIVEP3 isoform X1 [Gasterosteus aculeatus aculeatus]XP_040044644.1 transcription factor HIVEP3 isoform X1 [Gasterosteus aculeatus aculeatus]XP_040044645.1 transcription factor HIVEP3 isoform X1 [Gasterosteus aculeatus aculeatus]